MSKHARRGNLMLVMFLLALVIGMAVFSFNFMTKTDVTTTANLVRDFGVMPRRPGAFSALMGALLVISVLSLGLQATGARRISAAAGPRSYKDALTLRRAESGWGVVLPPGKNQK